MGDDRRRDCGYGLASRRCLWLSRKSFRHHARCAFNFWDHWSSSGLFYKRPLTQRHFDRDCAPFGYQHPSGALFIANSAPNPDVQSYFTSGVKMYLHLGSEPIRGFFCLLLITLGMSEEQNQNNLMTKIVSLAKRRGFVFPGSEIYGGLANTWDYGPLGTRLLQNIKNLWWKKFIETRNDVFPVDTGILMNPKVWETSGHVQSFTDPLVECQNCHKRFREDHLEDKTKCPECGGSLGSPKQFNLMFKTHIGPVEEAGQEVFLRPETAQGMFVNFKNVLISERPRLPFGIAQIGKAFRNEITPGNFIFRTLELELMEIEYFVNPTEWEPAFEGWKEQMWDWITALGVPEEKLRWRVHEKDELSHYSRRTEDIEFEFPFGWGELYGLAYRTDFDLKNHSEKSGEDLSYEDPETRERFIPHVVEPAFGLNRTALVVLLSAYTEDPTAASGQAGSRVFLKLPPALAPYKAAVFPLVANKPDIVEKARETFNLLRSTFPVAFDDRGNIGKRYFAQDEIGTPYCITVDYQTLEDNTVTVRDRDTAKQERIATGQLQKFLQEKLV